MTGVGAGTVLAERYRLEQKLGEGAMGSVWKAEHLMLGSPVAIKLLDESIAAHSIALARFMREARAAASLKSVHVVQIHDYGVDHQMPFIAMEFLEGETLANRLKRVHRLPAREAALILTHVARGISKAHVAGVVHRDLKPDNIFLLKEDDEEYAKVLDFGVAKAGEGVFAATLTSAGKLLGTPAYMSAEQAAGRSVDHRTDIWSLAVIAFECLTGDLPFVGDDLPDLLHAIHDGPIPVPSRMSAVPEGFDAWFARGVARNIDDRFYSAKAMVTELRAICGLETTTRGPAPAPVDEEQQRETLTPNEQDLPDDEDTTSTRIARAFRNREEEEASESLDDDIIRTQDVLADSVARPVDDILTESDFDDETPVTEPTGAGTDTGEFDAKNAANRTADEPDADAVHEGRLASQPPTKPPTHESVPESEPGPVSASRAAADEVTGEFDDPPPPTAPPVSHHDPPIPGSITSTGTVVSVAPHRRGQFGLLVGTAIVVVLGTAAGIVAFVLRAPSRTDLSPVATAESPPRHGVTPVADGAPTPRLVPSTAPVTVSPSVSSDAAGQPPTEEGVASSLPPTASASGGLEITPMIAAPPGHR